MVFGISWGHLWLYQLEEKYKYIIQTLENLSSSY